MQTPPSRFDRYSFVYLWLVGAVSFAVRLHAGIHHHFWLWCRAAREILSGVNPEPIVTSPDVFHRAWLYPPHTALFFAPFLPFPLPVGQALYLFLSLGVFATGYLRFTRRLNSGSALAGLGLFFLVLSSDLTGAILPVRLEIVSAGILLWAGAWLIEGRLLFWAGLLLGTAASWKLQLASCAGLTAILALGFARKQALSYLGGLIAGVLLLPVILLLCTPLPVIVDSYRSWFINMQVGTDDTWRGYQSLLAFTAAQFHWPHETATLTRAVGVITLGFAALVAGVVRKVGPAAPRTPERTWLVTFTIAMGSAYTILFSPMSQGAGFILGVPILLLVAMERKKAEKQGPWTVLLVVHWALSSLLFSDLVPRSWEQFAQANLLRPLGFALLTTVLVIRARSYFLPMQRSAVSDLRNLERKGLTRLDADPSRL